MRKLIDITGQRYGRLTVVERVPGANKHGQVQWLCKCDCGETTIVAGYSLKTGNNKSCGCLRGNPTGHLTHGQSNTPLHRKWCGIKRLTSNPNCASNPYYHRHGITVCDEWMDSFETFRDWALSVGYRDGMEIRRRDQLGPFGPENCYFVWPPKREVRHHGKE